MHEIEQYEHAGRIVRLLPDDDPGSPREWENLGTMVCEHSRYDLGDTTVSGDTGRDDFRGWESLTRYLRIVKHAAVILPLGLYDHSGITMYAGGGAHVFDPGGWDSGTVGYIYATREQITEEYGADTPENRERAAACLRGEIETYATYLEGGVVGYVVEDEEGNVLESVWGFFDLDDARSEANAAAEHNPAPSGASLACLSLPYTPEED